MARFNTNVSIQININTPASQPFVPTSYVPMSPAAFYGSLGQPALPPAPFVPSLTYVDGIAYS